MKKTSYNLLPAATAELTNGLEKLHGLLGKAYPLKPKHRSSLHLAVRKLSAYLTVDRENLPRDYMAQAESLSAYLYYFLPWNIYRQSRLLDGLQLDLPDNTRILDIGSGPLTFEQAMWLGRPELRIRKLSILAVDRAEPALKIGRTLFRGLCADNECGWQVRTEKQIAGCSGNKAVDLLVAANFLNEIDTTSTRSRRQRGPDPDPDHDTPADRLLDSWSNMVKENGTILLIEPGIRGSARQLVKIREAALNHGWRIVGPCTHTGECPMPGKRSTGWCHFTTVPGGLPEWLYLLSRKAKLAKDRASLSYLMLTRGEGGVVKVCPPLMCGSNESSVRIISDAFTLPDGQSGRYGCSNRGLVLLKSRERAGDPRCSQPGMVVKVGWPEKIVKDYKSGGIIINSGK